MRQAAARKATRFSPEEKTDFSFQSAGMAGTDSSRDRFDPQLDIQPIRLQPSFETHSDDRYHVNDLLKFSDKPFVQNAYLAILKRPADEAGAGSFLESLRSGALNKIDVLAQLRFSAEGREKAVQLEGLRLPALTRKLYRIPVVGYFLNLAVAFGRLPSMVRNQRAFENHVLAQQETLVSQINHIGRMLVSNARQTADVVAERTALVRELETQLQNLRSRLDALGNEQAAAHDVVLTRINESTRYVEERLNEEANERDAALAVLGERLSTSTVAWQEQQQLLKSEFSTSVDAEHDARARALDQLSASLRDHSEAKFSSLERQTVNDLKAMQARHQQLTSELVLQHQRLTRLLEAADSRLPAPFTSEELQIVSREESHLLDAFYAAFDEQFRGNRDEIKERLKVYLPFVTRLGPADSTARIIDIGCGRGEWLELLKEHDLSATGVDANTVLAQQCSARGLQVVEEDLLSYLREQEDESVSVISGFHIVEHLPIETLVKVLNETMRVLKSGGVLLLETPNPRNVLVGSCNFYFDPTHRNPLPSEVLKFLVESRGFARVEVLPLNPSDEKPVAGDSELVDRFNRYFYGPMDYGVVGWKPQPAGISSPNH